MLTSCSCKDKVFVDRVTTVKVPVKCTVPKVYCDFNRTTYSETISALLECIINYKEAAKVCQGKVKDGNQ